MKLADFSFYSKEKKNEYYFYDEYISKRMKHFKKFYTTKISSFAPYLCTIFDSFRYWSDMDTKHTLFFNKLKNTLLMRFLRLSQNLDRLTYNILFFDQF